MIRGEEEARWSRGEEEGVAGPADEEKKQQAGSEFFFREERRFLKF